MLCASFKTTKKNFHRIFHRIQQIQGPQETISRKTSKQISWSFVTKAIHTVLQLLPFVGKLLLKLKVKGSFTFQQWKYKTVPISSAQSCLKKSLVQFCRRDLVFFINHLLKISVVKHASVRYDIIKTCPWNFFTFSWVVHYRKICRNKV